MICQRPPKPAKRSKDGVYCPSLLDLRAMLISPPPHTLGHQLMGCMYLRFAWTCEVSLQLRAKGEAKAKQWLIDTCSTKSVAVEG